jgi:ParB/RepB/Spo0J family partition protein
MAGNKPINAANAKLTQLPVDFIDRNPENPRIIFRPEEMNELMDSISRWGVQVPITAYRNKDRFVLIDGERRWRCCRKLNLKTIPALVQDPPDQLTNVLLMFNIHALREQWDLLTIALKLRDIIKLHVDKHGAVPTEPKLSADTGLKRSVIRRCHYLLDLPMRYHEMILKELQKPKRQQVFTEDFFIEMEKALRTVERAMPEVIPNKEDVRRVLIKKFRDNVIDNRVHFREVAKIARATNVDADPERAEEALTKLFEPNDYSISEAFEDSVSADYAERDVATRLESLIERLRRLEPDEIDAGLKKQLRELVRVAERLLKE